jgi:hypothetical protein
MRPRPFNKTRIEIRESRPDYLITSKGSHAHISVSESFWVTRMRLDYVSIGVGLGLEIRLMAFVFFFSFVRVLSRLLISWGGRGFGRGSRGRCIFLSVWCG